MRRLSGRGFEMRLDIYHDQIEKYLFVKSGTDIKKIDVATHAFMKGMKFQCDVDIDKLPASLNKDEVLLAIEKNGFHAARFKLKSELFPILK